MFFLYHVLTSCVFESTLECVLAIHSLKYTRFVNIYSNIITIWYDVKAWHDAH